MQAKPTKPQQILLLKKELNLLSHNVDLPELSHLKIPILKKKKWEKEALLASLCNDENEEIWTLDSLKSLKQDILFTAFQNAIQSTRFEIVHWNTKVQKYADPV